MTCIGWRYNFKEGGEICKNKSICPFYSPNINNEKIRFKTIGEFRNCKKYNDKRAVFE